jgi:hypothetical protein
MAISAVGLLPLRPMSSSGPPPAPTASPDSYVPLPFSGCHGSEYGCRDPTIPIGSVPRGFVQSGFCSVPLDDPGIASCRAGPSKTLIYSDGSEVPSPTCRVAASFNHHTSCKTDRLRNGSDVSIASKPCENTSQKPLIGLNETCKRWDPVSHAGRLAWVYPIRKALIRPWFPTGPVAVAPKVSRIG